MLFSTNSSPAVLVIALWALDLLAGHQSLALTDAGLTKSGEVAAEGYVRKPRRSLQVDAVKGARETMEGGAEFYVDYNEYNSPSADNEEPPSMDKDTINDSNEAGGSTPGGAAGYGSIPRDEEQPSIDNNQDVTEEEETSMDHDTSHDTNKLGGESGSTPRSSIVRPMTVMAASKPEDEQPSLDDGNDNDVGTDSMDGADDPPSMDGGEMLDDPPSMDGGDMLNDSEDGSGMDTRVSLLSEGYSSSATTITWSSIITTLSCAGMAVAIFLF